MEESFFFKRDGHDLFGVLHLPESGDSSVALVMCSPFAEEKLWAHRVYVNFARSAASSGFAVLRFDYMGTGDSGGDFEEGTVETRLHDIDCAARLLQDRVPSCEHTSLLGLRFGATLAALAAERNPLYAHAILWEPLTGGTDYMRDVLRSNLATQMAVYRKIRHTREDLITQLDEGQIVNTDGYGLTQTLFTQVSLIDLLSHRKRFSNPVLVVQVNARDKPFTRANQLLVESYPVAGLSSAMEQPFWKEIRPYYPRANNLTRITLEWLKRPLAVVKRRHLIR